MRVRFVEAPVEQDAQLRAWGLSREPLAEAVLWAKTFYDDCTPFDPHGFKFGIAYARAARRLRELLIPTRQWKRDDLDNQTAVRNESLKLRLYPCNFCDATADKNREPKNLSEKGPAARRNAASNPDLFSSLERFVPQPMPKVVRGYTTLLLGMNFETDSPKAEVSLPVKFMGGRFTSFSIRVPVLSGETTPPLKGRGLDTDDVFGEVDIPIRGV